MEIKITLTPRELLFISALLNGTEFLGIPDAFFGMEDTEIQQVLLNLQSSLEEKGYAEMDFDGSFVLKEDVSDMVDICANCEIFVVVDKNEAGKAQIRELYYVKATSIVKLSESEEGYSLTSINNVDNLIEHIAEGVKLQYDGTPPLKEVKLTNEMLSDIKTKPGNVSQSHRVKLLVEQGCDELSAKTIISGLAGKSDYYSVIITVLEGEKEGVYNITLIASENSIYKITPTTVDGEQEAVQFNMLTAKEAKIAWDEVIRGSIPSERKVAL